MTHHQPAITAPVPPVARFVTFGLAAGADVQSLLVRLAAWHDERAVVGMAGLDDGLVDGLFRFTRPRTGGHYFCPPVREGRLDLSAFGL
jgi:deferrochelatase/peroxidase EfeB